MLIEHPEQKKESSYSKGRKEFLYGVRGIYKLITNEKTDYMHQGAVKRWLLLLHTAKQSIPSIVGENVRDSEVGHFLKEKFNGEEKYMIQAFINTICTNTPQEWLDEMGEDLGVDICKTNYPMLEEYSPRRITYATAELEEREHTLEFVQEICRQGC